METAKKNIIEVVELIESSISPFQYHDNVSVHADDKGRIPDKNEVLYYYNTNYINLSDIHLVRELALLVFATLGQLVGQINYKTQITDELKGKLPTESDAIKSRLNTLCRVGLVKKYKFYPFKGVKSKNNHFNSYYLVTPHGYNYIKRILHYNGNYDEYLAITPIEEVFKYLSTNTIINSLYNEPCFRGYENDIRFFHKNSKQMKSLYSEVNTEVDGIKYKVYVEPLKFKFNQQRLNKKETKDLLIERMAVLKTSLSTASKSGKQKYALLLAEDIDGLKMISYYLSNYLADFKDYSYITTDAAVFKNSLKNSMLKMDFDSGGSVSLKPSLPPFL